MCSISTDDEVGAELVVEDDRVASGVNAAYALVVQLGRRLASRL